MSIAPYSAFTSVAAPAPLIWPERDIHALTSVDLEPQLPSSVEPLLPALRQLAALGDALRALQTIDGSFVNDLHARELAVLSAQLMNELADADAVSPEQAEIIRRRARALSELSHDLTAAQAEAELITPQPLTVIAGPFCTFRNKTHAPLHSVIACTAHPDGNELVAGIDASRNDALAEVNELAATADVEIATTCSMQITDLIAMGGESNAFPKHFAYFLPEDEGVGVGEKYNKTILFRNVYRLRYERISRPLDAALLDGEKLSPEMDVASVLITWMRGHDIAHGVSTVGAGRTGPADVGHEPWYSLQEAIADAYGTAMALTPLWLNLAGCEARDMIALYLAEALHYLRRGPWNWSDAGAACVELSFLASNGYLDVGGDGRIAWETQRVQEGMYELCATLEREVVSAERASSVQGILDRYGWRTDSPIAPTVRALRDELGGVPTSLAYL